VIGNSKLNNKELITNIYQSIIIVISVKAIVYAIVSYWVDIFGPAQSNAQAELFSKVINVSNFVNSVIVPIILIYLTRCICELVYRFSLRIGTED